MDFFANFFAQGARIVWGPITVALLLGTGIYLSLGTKLVQFRKLGHSIKYVFSKDENSDGDISSFQAFMTSLAATIGTGNIVGVASAIALGGPGAIFWMWVSAAFGGATKFTEGMLAIKYRTTNDKGEKSGGPMYYIGRGIKDRYGINASWLGWSFALFGFIASFGTGNMVQANAISESVELIFGIKPFITGIIIAILTALVILGGIKNIGKVTEKIVPAMALFYVGGALIGIIFNIEMVPMAFKMIFENAFTGNAVEGGLIGSVIRFGVARGIFSNEAGLGSAPIAHAASKNENPVTEGLIASLGAFIATILVCTITALIILTSGLVNIQESGAMMIVENLNGAELTATAFDTLLPGIGGYVTSIGLIFFSFSTIIGWYYYGSKCIEYIGGLKSAELYKWAWVALSYVGSVTSLKTVWSISDMFNGLMALPNLIGLLALSPLVFKMVKEYDSGLSNEEKSIRRNSTVTSDYLG